MFLTMHRKTKRKDPIGAYAGSKACRRSWKKRTFVSGVRIIFEIADHVTADPSLVPTSDMADRILIARLSLDPSGMASS